MIETGRLVGRTGKQFENLDALSTPNNLFTLRRLILALKPERTLEIGLSFGGSALMFAATHRDLNRSPANQHVAIDPFQSTVWDSCGLMALERAALREYIDFRAVFSAIELPRMMTAGDRFGLVYIDGSHLFEDVFVDAYFVTRLLEPGSVVTFDDSSNRHVSKVLSFLRTNYKDLLEEIDLRPYRAPGHNGLKYMVTRRLGKAQLTAFRRIGPVKRNWDAAFARF
jgi:cephalosporin hydroxylase